MANVLLPLVVACLAVGCAGNVDSSSWGRTYSKPDTTAEQRQNDALDCVPTKAQLFNNWISDFGPKDHQICMKAKGYTVSTAQ